MPAETVLNDRDIQTIQALAAWHDRTGYYEALPRFFGGDSAALAKLVRRGLVSRRLAPGHARTYRYRLTDAGREYLKAAAATSNQR